MRDNHLMVQEAKEARDRLKYVLEQLLAPLDAEEAVEDLDIVLGPATLLETLEGFEAVYNHEDYEGSRYRVTDDIRHRACGSVMAECGNSEPQSLLTTALLAGRHECSPRFSSESEGART